MFLNFKSNSSNEGFSTWAKQFKEISNCLLIEIDVENKRFISKTFTEDKSLVKLSEISFESAGYEIVSILDDKKKKVNLKSRVKTGIFMILGKFIDVISTFSGVDHEMVVSFSEFKEKKEVEYHSQAILFKSKTLKIQIITSNISEFNEISDDMFYNRAYVANEPIVSKVSHESLKNLLSVSSLFSVGATQDIMKFYTEKDDDGVWRLFVRDGSVDSYDYLIGTCEVGETELSKVNLSIFRGMFIKATKGLTEDLVFKFSSKNPNRILFETSNGNTKMVISSVNI